MFHSTCTPSKEILTAKCVYQLCYLAFIALLYNERGRVDVIESFNPAKRVPSPPVILTVWICGPCVVIVTPNKVQGQQQKDWLRQSLCVCESVSLLLFWGQWNEI